MHDVAYLELPRFGYVNEMVGVLAEEACQLLVIYEYISYAPYLVLRGDLIRTP